MRGSLYRRTFRSMTLQNMQTSAIDEIPDANSVVIRTGDAKTTMRCNRSDRLGMTLKKMQMERVVFW